jgi:hypothetical protein
VAGKQGAKLRRKTTTVTTTAETARGRRRRRRKRRRRRRKKRKKKEKKKKKKKMSPWVSAARAHPLRTARSRRRTRALQELPGPQRWRGRPSELSVKREEERFTKAEA